jgi:hypothetical protein
VVAELRKSGPLPLNQLSSKVVRPKELTVKYKAFLTQHSDTFRLEGEKVSLQ